MAAAVGFVLVHGPIHLALQTAVVTLGGFVGTRVVCYLKDGVDADKAFATHQHGMFTAEVLGTLVGTYLLLTEIFQDFRCI